MEQHGLFIKNAPENCQGGPLPAAQQLGKLGGTARARSLTPEQRKEIARKGAATRWRHQEAIAGAQAEAVSNQSKGGYARAQKLSPEERRAIASMAAQRRWTTPPEPHHGVTELCRRAMCSLAEASIALSRVFDPSRSPTPLANDLAKVENKLRRALTEITEARSALNPSSE